MNVSVSVSRAVTASAADAPPMCLGVEDPVHIALSEVHREPACAIYGPGVVVRGSGQGESAGIYRVGGAVGDASPSVQLHQVCHVLSIAPLY